MGSVYRIPVNPVYVSRIAIVSLRVKLARSDVKLLDMKRKEAQNDFVTLISAYHSIYSVHTFDNSCSDAIPAPKSASWVLI